MTRRLLLALVAIAALGFLSGCSAAGSLHMAPVNDTALAEHASQSTTDNTFSPRSIDRNRAGEIIENGSGTILGPEPPLDTDLPYEHDRQYYALSAEVGERVSGTITLVRIDYNATNPNGTTIPFRDLSTADKRELEPLLSGSPSRLRDGHEIDDLVVYTDAERENSLITAHGDEYVTVRYRGETYEIDVQPFRSTTLKRYRYEPTRIANSSKAYATQVKDQYGFMLGGINESERQVLERAISDGYYADSTDDDAFGSLVERFRRHESVTGDEYGGSWIVRYDGQWYWAEMDYGGFVEAAGASETTPDATPN